MKKLFLICLGFGIVLGIALFAMSQSSIVTGAGSSSAANVDNGTTFTYSGTGGLSLAAGIALTGSQGAATTISTTATNTNLFISPNGTALVEFPAGAVTTPSLHLAGQSSSTGFWAPGASNTMNWSSGGANVASFVSGGLGISTAGGVLFSSTTGAGAGSKDGGLSRGGVGIVAVGNGTVGDTTGTLKFKAQLSDANCAGVGTAAQPSVASCTSAMAGAFSCATNATSSCQVNTTAVTANSEIIVQQTANTGVGTRLSVTCNTAASTLLPMVTSQVAATSFTIQLTQPVTNPDCFYYSIIN